MEQAYIYAHISITAAYMLIPAILVIALMHEKRTHEHKELTPNERALARIVYAFFVLFCGLGHLEGWLSFVSPDLYPFFTVWHLVTAAVSWAAVIVTTYLRAKIVVGI